MRFLRIIWLSLALLSGSLFIQAQPAWQLWNTGNSGLPDNSVRALAPDPAGGIWIGTDFGLARFNGSTFTAYHTTNSPLPDNDIRALATEADTLWVGTFSGGLLKWFGSSSVLYNTGNSALPENQVRSITIDVQGRKWIGTSGGLTLINGSQWTVWNTLNSGFPSNNITSVAIAADGSRYIATINGGLLRQTDTTLQVFTTSNSALADNTILALQQTNNGALLTGTSTAGLVLYHSDSVFTAYHPGNSANPSFNVLALAADQAGNYFLGSETAGLTGTDLSSWWTFHTQNSPLPDNYVQSLAFDQGMLWIGMRTGGLARLQNPVQSAVEIQYSNYMYPNPATSTSRLRLNSPIQEADIRILNSTNMVQRQLRLSGEVTELPALSLPSGIYLIELISGRTVLRQRLVILP